MKMTKIFALLLCFIKTVSSCSDSVSCGCRCCVVFSFRKILTKLSLTKKKKKKSLPALTQQAADIRKALSRENLKISIKTRQIDVIVQSDFA